MPHVIAIVLLGLVAAVAARSSHARRLDVDHDNSGGQHIELFRRTNGMKWRNDDDTFNGAIASSDAARADRKLTLTLNNAVYNARSSLTHPMNNASSLDLERFFTRRGMASQALQAYDSHSMWAGTVRIGTPAQTFTIDFDTGSADLIIASSACTTKACKAKKRYNPKKSKTAVKTATRFNNAYADGSSTTGFMYQDTVAVGGLKATTQSVNAASTIAGLIASVPTDGLMGLSYPYLSSTNSSGVFATLLAQRKVTHGQFGFQLSDSDAKGASKLFLGGTDKKAYSGAIEWHPVMPYSSASGQTYAYWAIDGGSATANGVAATNGPKTFIVDSGTALIYAPPSDAATFYAALHGAKPCTTGPACAGVPGLWQFPCTSSYDYPNIAFSVSGGKPISLGSDFNLGLTAAGSAFCVGSILSGAKGPTGTEWLVGAAFMQRTYTAFDASANAIGFATLK